MSEKKNIYSLNIKEMRRLLRDFSRTLYGRTVFFLAYFVPVMSFLVLIGLAVAGMLAPADNSLCCIISAFFVFMATFILGNIYYYHELRVFAEKR